MAQPKRPSFSRAPLGLLALASSLLAGCMASPTPLAPVLQGSVGMPHQGVLTVSEELPENGSGFRRYRRLGTAHFGLPRLVQGLEAAARIVGDERPGGARLVIGDLSAATGGKIPRHNSHRSGRDVDLLLFITNPEGVPLESPGFVPLGADGFAKLPDGRYIRLDVERQWLLIRALLANEGLGVQFLFISRDLEALIIQYALAREPDLEIVSHAQTVMVQPIDSLPHDDHIHMRIACAPNESVQGCMGGGPHWAWLAPLPESHLTDAELTALIFKTDPFPLPLGPAQVEKVPDASADDSRSESGRPPPHPSG